VITGYAQNGDVLEMLKLFSQAQQAGGNLNQYTPTSVLSALDNLEALEQGKDVHGFSLKVGFKAEVSVGNALLAMYAKCRSFAVACQLFDKMFERDVVSWTLIICTYTHSGLGFEVLMLFHQMQLADVTPDTVTMGGVLQACASLAALQQGKKIHGYVIRSGLESDVSVGLEADVISDKRKSTILNEENPR